MKVRSLFGSLIVVPLLVCPGQAQFTAQDLAQRPQWEAFLCDAEIFNEEQLAFERGVTEPWKITLRQGKVVRKAIWKDAIGVRGGYLEGWRYEIAAYRMDKLLGIGMVPPTVEKVREGRPGSCQLWIDGTGLYRDLTKRAAYRDAFTTEGWKNAG